MSSSTTNLYNNNNNNNNNNNKNNNNNNNNNNCILVYKVCWHSFLSWSLFENPVKQRNNYYTIIIIGRGYALLELGLIRNIISNLL